MDTGVTGNEGTRFLTYCLNTLKVTGV